MGVDRFYCPDFRAGQPAHLDGDEARHLARVRRVPAGAEVEIFDGRGQAAVAEVAGLGRDRVDLRVKHAIAGIAAPAVALTLATAIPKGDRFDWLIEKATELGVERVVPLVTERSAVDPRSAKLDRLRRAIVEACKQCRRDRLMALDDPIPWERYARQAEAPPARLIAHPGGAGSWPPIGPAGGGRVVVAIGPEGGFADGELALAAAHGWAAIDLTPTVLRIETAALAAAARVLIGGDRPAGG